MKDEDYHLDENDVDRFPRQPVRPVLLAPVMAYAPRSTI